MAEETLPEVSNTEVFGKFISLTPDAKAIMDEYDHIRTKTREAIVGQLQRQALMSEASYYQKDVKAFIFKLDILKQYIQEVGESSNYLLVINASENLTPTTVIALSKSHDSRNFTIIPNSAGEVPEHPGKNGNIIMGAEQLHGPKEVIFRLE